MSRAIAWSHGSLHLTCGGVSASIAQVGPDNGVRVALLCQTAPVVLIHRGGNLHKRATAAPGVSSLAAVHHTLGWVRTHVHSACRERNPSQGGQRGCKKAE